MFSKNKYKIGIIGIGYVGGALRNWFEKEEYPLFLYDKYKKIGSIENVNKADIVFICVPTPFYKKGGYDDFAVSESLKNLSGKKTVIIKSTILPGSTEKFQKKFPQHKILFNPEFLRAKTAKKDFLNPKRQIIGVTKKSKSMAQKILGILPKAPYKKIILSKEAEMVKYFSNAFLASKVVFANQIYDLCQALGIDYSIVKEVAGRDPRISHSHLDVFRDGYRGYKGGCFPKDVNSLLQLAKKLNVDFDFLKTAKKINEDLINKNEKQDEK
ncbi:MAG: hypothetical protein ACKKMO_02100 [Candidatus Nealsonbacteria bacterium]